MHTMPIVKHKEIFPNAICVQVSAGSDETATIGREARESSSPPTGGWTGLNQHISGKDTRDLT